jgi:hypothetical protein
MDGLHLSAHIAITFAQRIPWDLQGHPRAHSAFVARRITATMQVQANDRGLLDKLLAKAIVTRNQEGNLALQARATAQLLAIKTRGSCQRTLTHDKPASRPDRKL